MSQIRIFYSRAIYIHGSPFVGGYHEHGRNGMKVDVESLSDYNVAKVGESLIGNEYQVNQSVSDTGWIRVVGYEHESSPDLGRPEPQQVVFVKLEARTVDPETGEHAVIVNSGSRISLRDLLQEMKTA